MAREMHDTLIQGCAGVSALLEAHSSLGDAQNGGGNELLDYARTQLRFTIDEAREAVWNLRQSAAAELAPQLQRMADQTSHEFGVPVGCQVSGKPFGFDQSTVHEVLMVAREALYNALRHGRPKTVRVDVEFAQDACIVKITDDGTGFDTVAVSTSPSGHYGLIGIRERVERIGGRFTLDSRVGAGTRLIIEVPRAVEASSQAPEIDV